MLLHFTKMEGCGNDYVYVNGFTEHVPQEEKPDAVRRLSDRHFGIGGDGVIFINPSENADFEMEMYNADGSRGEMCGNGIRCVAKYVYDRGMTQGRTEFDVESFGKVKHLTLTCQDGRALYVRVNMGEPILDAPEIPVLAEHTKVLVLTPSGIASAGTSPDNVGGERLPAGQVLAHAGVVDEPIDVKDREWRMTCVSMGNPHAVVFLESTSDIHDFDLACYGPSFEHHRLFPNRINTEFVQVVDRQHVKMRVWERGTGETLACGTGTCATAVACVLNGKTDRKVEVEVLGGKILVEWDEATNQVFMTGPAREVFSGEIVI